MLSDLRYAFRSLAKSPNFTAVVVLTLALGIGATTTMLSIVDTVLIRALPFAQPDRLVTVWERNPEHGYEANGVAPANFEDWVRNNHSFEQMEMYASAARLDLAVGDRTERVTGYAITPGLFSLLGVAPASGRAFSSKDISDGRDDLVVLSRRFCRQLFGNDSNVIGKTVSLDGKSRTIIGIMPDKFVFPGGTGVVYGDHDTPADLWLPLVLSPKARAYRGDHAWKVIARLHPGVTLASARAEMDAIQGGIQKAYPNFFMGTHCTLIPFREQCVGNVRTELWLLLGAVVLVLLIVCANTAALLLVRAAGRRREFAVRIALGASRWVLVRQLLTEGLILSLLGGAAGALLSVWLVSLVASSAGANLAASTPGWQTISVDGRILAVTLIVALGTGVLFGLAPAWQCSRIEPNEALKAGPRGASLRSRTQRLLVVLQVASATLLLLGAGLLLRSFAHLQRVDPGFDRSNLLSFQLGLTEQRYRATADRNGFVQRLCDELQTLPGVDTVAATTALPLFNGESNNRTFRIVGAPPLDPGKYNSANLGFVTPDFLRVMRIPLRNGRAIAAADQATAPFVCLINETLARRYFPDQNPVGRRLQLVANRREMEVIGVVQDIRQNALNDGLRPTPMRSIFEPMIYMPYAQIIESHRTETSIVIRTASGTRTLSGPIRETVRRLDREQPISNLQTFNELVDANLAQPHFRLVLLGAFASAAMFFAALGLYGVLSQSVSQRTREIGVRMALGAPPQNIVATILRDGMALTLLGIGLGTTAALIFGKWISSLLVGVTAADPLTFAVVLLVVPSIALLAIYLPARRATKVNPVEALRAE